MGGGAWPLDSTWGTLPGPEIVTIDSMGGGAWPFDSARGNLSGPDMVRIFRLLSLS